MQDAEERLSYLDDLRAVAVILVVLYHYYFRRLEISGEAFTLFSSIFRAGHVGVMIFFMLSGYLIYRRLSQTPLDELRAFFAIRFCRLYPSFWFCCLLTFIIVKATAGPATSPSITTLLANLTMTPRLLGADFIDGAYWSLEVELIFYVAIGILFAVLKPAARMPVLLLWSLVAITISLTEPLGPIYSILRIITISNWIPYFVVGILCRQYHTGKVSLQKFIPLTLILLAPDIYRYAQSKPELLLILTLSIIYVTGKGFGLSLGRIGGWVASISYPLYLIHQEIGYTAIEYMQRLGVGEQQAIILVVAAVAIIAQCVHASIEGPAHRAAIKFYAR